MITLLRSARRFAWTAAPTVITAAALLLASSPASAQISRVGLSKDVVSNGGALIGNDVCYDPANKIYFGTIAHGYVYGAFMDTSGGVIKSFTLGSAFPGKPWGHYPRCSYSPELNGGKGGFLVVWHQDDATPNFLHSVVVSYPSGVVGSESVITDGTQFGTFYQNGAAIAYSPTSHKFLVAWATYSWNIQGRFIDAKTGAPLGGTMTFFGKPGGDAGWRDPAVAWNPATDEFGVAYAGWSGSSSLLGLVRVSASNGASSTPVNFGHGPVGSTPSIGVNSANSYVVGWSASGGARSLEFAQSGSPTGGSKLISSRMGTALSFALAFNPMSGTFLAVSEDLGGTPDIAGVELVPNGAPTTAAMVLTNGGKLGSFVPRVTARTDAAEWNISYSRNYLNGLSDQIVRSHAVGAAGPPAAAVLVSPTGKIATTTPTFTWNAVSGATQYQVWVTDSTGTPVVKAWISASTAGCAAGTGTCSQTSGVTLPPGTSTWWVQTWNETGGYGPWSSGLSFAVALPPGAAALVSAVSTGALRTFTWNAVPNATFYYLWVTDSTGIRIRTWYTASAAQCAGGIGTCSVSTDVPLAGGRATWWIQTYNADGYGPWSAGQTFDVLSAPSPTGVTIGGGTTRYRWTISNGATYYFLWVTDSSGTPRIQKWLSSAEADCMNSANPSECSATLSTPLSAGSAWFWVQAWSESAGYSPWSGGLNFTY